MEVRHTLQWRTMNAALKQQVVEGNETEQFIPCWWTESGQKRPLSKTEANGIQLCKTFSNSTLSELDTDDIEQVFFFSGSSMMVFVHLCFNDVKSIKVKYPTNTFNEWLGYQYSLILYYA